MSEHRRSQPGLAAIVTGIGFGAAVMAATIHLLVRVESWDDGLGVLLGMALIVLLTGQIAGRVIERQKALDRRVRVHQRSRTTVMDLPELEEDDLTENLTPPPMRAAGPARFTSEAERAAWHRDIGEDTQVIRYPRL